MDYDKGFILQKTPDWSVLNDRNDHSCVGMCSVEGLERVHFIQKP